MGAHTSGLAISPHPSHGGKLRLFEISVLPSHLTPASVLGEAQSLMQTHAMPS